MNINDLKVNDFNTNIIKELEVLIAKLKNYDVLEAENIKCKSEKQDYAIKVLKLQEDLKIANLALKNLAEHHYSAYEGLNLPKVIQNWKDDAEEELSVLED